MHRNHLMTAFLGLFVSLPALGQIAGEQPASLAVKNVALYRNGIGYFEHAGEVAGSQRVQIILPSGELNDVLKSLTVLDQGGGQVSAVTFDSAEPLQRRLSALSLKLEPGQGLVEFLNQIRGAKIEIRRNQAILAGRIMGAELRQRKSGEYIMSQEVQLTIFTPQGEVHTVDLPSLSVLRLVDPELAGELSSYLELLNSAHKRDLRPLMIQTSGAGSRTLQVSYTVEAPIWKTTYRLVLDSKRKPLLQGWAIVENLTPNDWNGITLSLVAGSPVSFVQNLSQPLYGRRKIIPLPEGAQTTPQLHEPTLVTASGMAVISGIIRDASQGSIPGATVMVRNSEGAQVLEVMSDDSGRYRMELSPGMYSVQAMVAGFKPAAYMNIEIHSGRVRSLDFTLELGNVSETVMVMAEAPTMQTEQSSVGRRRRAREGTGAGPGVGSQISLGSEASIMQAVAETAATRRAGEQFEYRLRQPVTIRRNQSALLPIVHSEVEGEKVSVYNEGFSERHSRLAVWLNNSTGLTLAEGSFTTTDGDAYAGEGLMDTLNPGERRVLSYALDTAIEISTNRGTERERVERLEIVRGVLKFTDQVLEKKTYLIRNNDDKARVVLIEHPVRPGWTLQQTPQPAESSSAYHRFRIEATAKSTTEFAVREANQKFTTYQLRNVSADQIVLWGRQQRLDPETERILASIVERKNNLHALDKKNEALDDEQEAITEDQTRIRENLAKLGNSREEVELRQRYVRKLAGQEDRLKEILVGAENLDRLRAEGQKELDAYIQALALERKL